MMNRIVCIAGPTASGKSKFALKVARSLNGEIINADALQVYRELSVLSARPRFAEMQGIVHHLYGHVPASTRYSSGQWLRAVDPLIIDILARGKTPVLVGGTGLYFKALTQGFADIPMVGADVRAQTQALLDEGIEQLKAQANRLDPIAAARVLGNDPQRLFRIVSVALGTGRRLSDWQKNTKPVLPYDTWSGVVLLPPREAIYERINARFADMVKSGGLDEARTMKDLALAPDLPAMKAIGLRELIAYLDGDILFDDAIDKAMRETRRLAKRQHTWLRGQMKGWSVFDPLSETFSIEALK